MKPIFHTRDFSGLATQPRARWSVSSLTWSDQGGCYEARIDATGSPSALFQLTSLLRCPVTVYDDLGAPVWWGYVSEVSIGGEVYTYGAQMDSMANSVKVAYSYVAPGTNDVGTRKTTAAVTDAASIAEYGTKEALVSEAGMTDTTAAQKRDTYLSSHKYPQGTLTASGGAGMAQVICRGWFWTLSWRLASWPSLAAVSYTTTSGAVDQAIGAASGNQRGMQQITTGTQAVNALTVRVYAKKVGAPTDNLTVELYALDGSGNPTGSALTSGTLGGGSMGTSIGWVDVTLTEYELAASTQYGVVVRRSGTVDAVNYYVVQVNPGLGYTGGAFKLYNGTAWAARGTDADMLFQVMVNDKVISTTQIKDLIATYGQFLTGAQFDGLSGIAPSLASYRDGDTDALTEIVSLMNIGTTNGRRILAETTIDRLVVFREEPASTSVAYYFRSDGRINASTGAPLMRSEVPVGAWAQLADLPGTADSSLLLDPTTQYITAATWTPSNGMRPEFRGDLNLSTVLGSGNSYGELRPMVQGWTGPRFIPLQAPLTSTAFDGLFSSTAKTLIDLSTVFGVPAGVKAVLVRYTVSDTASATYDANLILSPLSTSGVGISMTPQAVNGRKTRGAAVIPCNADGDIYYQIAASGTSTFGATLEIWGYWL